MGAEKGSGAEAGGLADGREPAGAPGAAAPAGLQADPHRPCRVLAQVPVLTWMSDARGRVVFLSAHWGEFTGQPVERLLGTGLASVVHPEDRPRALAAFLGFESTRVRVVREYRVRRSDGLWRWLRDTALPAYDEAGGPSGHVGVCEDVTERHEFLGLVRFQRAVSSCLAGARKGPAFLEEVLRTIVEGGGFEEASVCRIPESGPTRLVVRYGRSGAERAECSCWRGSDRVSSPTFGAPCSRASVPIVGSYPLVAGETVTGLLTLGSREPSDVFLPLLESLQGTAAILGALLDIEQHEEGLRASEERYKALVEQSSEGVYLFDPATHRLLDGNARFLQMAGYAREELPRLTLEDLVAHDAASISANVSRLVALGEAVLGVREYRRKDGSLLPVEVSASLVKWRDESAVLVNVRDVSESRAAARALQELSHRLQLILDGAGEGILGLDGEGRLTFLNRAAADHLGWSAEDLLGERTHERFHHTRRDGSPHPPPECPVLATIRDGRRVEVSEDVFWRRDGSRFPVHYVATPIREDGRLAGAVVVFRDVSREERLESIAEAVETMNGLGYVFSTVRHELGNPVNSVKMALSVLRKSLGRLDPDTVRGYVERSLAELSRVEELLASLKNYSLYEDVAMREIDLGEFVRGFVAFVSRDFEARSVQVAAATAPGPVRVSADPRALRQVLLNLVANAAEAMDGRPGSVRLAIVPERDWASVRVEDDGPGMDPEVCRNLFRPFYTTKKSGTGLGLVIAKKMMARMGGAIDVESVRGHGTTITLSLRSEAPAVPS